MVECLLMGGGDIFDALSQEVAVELEEEPNQGNVFWRNQAFQIWIIFVSKTWIRRRVEPRVIAI